MGINKSSLAQKLVEDIDLFGTNVDKAIGQLKRNEIIDCYETLINIANMLDHYRYNASILEIIVGENSNAKLD